jgi:hypothetical protein
MAAEGFAGVLDYWKRFVLHAIERLLAEQLPQRSAVQGIELNHNWRQGSAGSSPH